MKKRRPSLQRCASQRLQASPESQGQLWLWGRPCGLRAANANCLLADRIEVDQPPPSTLCLELDGLDGPLPERHLAIFLKLLTSVYSRLSSRADRLSHSESKTCAARAVGPPIHGATSKERQSRWHFGQFVNLLENNHFKKNPVRGVVLRNRVFFSKRVMLPKLRK